MIDRNRLIVIDPGMIRTARYRAGGIRYNSKPQVKRPLHRRPAAIYSEIGIVVEGHADRKAVQRATSAKVGSDFITVCLEYSTAGTHCRSLQQSKIGAQSPLQVLVLGSSTSTAGAQHSSVYALLEKGLRVLERVYVLLDPDVAGRQARGQLETMFPSQFWHAFVPAHLATSAQASR